MPQTDASVPSGFRRAVASGLILPEDISRTRDVWTRDEYRLLDRALKLFTAKGMGLLLKCDHPACKSAPIEKIRQPGGGFVLRCAHADRVFTKAF
jgi:hypothetical protein